MHGFDARDFLQSRFQKSQVNIGWNTLKQDMDRLTYQTPGARDYEKADQGTNDGIRKRLSGPHDHQRCDYYPERAKHIAEDFEISSLDIQTRG